MSQDSFVYAFYINESLEDVFLKTAVKLDKYLGSTTLFYKIKATSPLFLR